MINSIPSLCCSHIFSTNSPISFTKFRPTPWRCPRPGTRFREFMLVFEDAFGRKLHKYDQMWWPAWNICVKDKTRECFYNYRFERSVVTGHQRFGVRFSWTHVSVPCFSWGHLSKVSGHRTLTVTSASWRLKPPICRLFVQQFAQASKLRNHWPFVVGNRRRSNWESVDVGSGEVLVPSANNSLPEQMLDKFYNSHTQGSFLYAPSQSETTVHCNVVSHWLGAYTKWTLHIRR